jgi:DNA-binding transcriptional regulator YhcF (GntR family)
MNMQNENPQFNNESKKYFTIVPNYVIEHSSAYELAVYTYIKRVAGEDGTCWESANNIGRKLNADPKTIRKYLKILLKKNLIEKVGVKGKTKPSAEYKIVKIWELNSAHYQEKDKGNYPLSQRKENESPNIREITPFDKVSFGNKEDNDKKMNYKERSNINNFKPKSREEYLCLQMAKNLNEQSMDFILSALRKYGFNTVERAYNDVKELARTREIKNKGAYFNEILKRLR